VHKVRNLSIPDENGGSFALTNYQFLLTFIIVCHKKIIAIVAGSYKEKGKSKKARKPYIRTMIKIPFWLFFSKIV
jgi:hypothetical protein